MPGTLESVTLAQAFVLGADAKNTFYFQVYAARFRREVLTQILVGIRATIR